MADVLRSVLTEAQAEAPRRRRSPLAVRVFRAFTELGPPFTVHTEPVLFRQGTLTLQVEQSAWLTEITFLAPQLIERLNQILGTATVKEIRVRQGALSVPAPRTGPPPRRPPPPLTAPQLERLEALGAEISSPELRELVLRAARWTIAES